MRSDAELPVAIADHLSDETDSEAECVAAMKAENMSARQAKTFRCISRGRSGLAHTSACRVFG